MTIDPAHVLVRPLAETDLRAAWQLRLRALREHPDAFGQPHAEAVALDENQVRHTWATRWNGGDNRVYAAFLPDRTLLGMTGLARPQRARERHRASVWGVYVVPEARGIGLGSRLLQAVIAYARELPGVLQLELQVVSTNHAAVRSYARAGFVQYGRIPRADILDGIEYDHDLMALMLDGRAMGPATSQHSAADCTKGTL